MFNTPSHGRSLNRRIRGIWVVSHSPQTSGERSLLSTEFMISKLLLFCLLDAICKNRWLMSLPATEFVVSKLLLFCLLDVICKNRFMSLLSSLVTRWLNHLYQTININNNIQKYLLCSIKNTFLYYRWGIFGYYH